MNKQTGAALIVALFIMALIAALVTAMIQQLQMSTTQTTSIVRTTQSDCYARGSVAWAREELMHEKIDTPIKAPTGKEGIYTIDSTLTDAQGLFNINNVIKPEYQPLFLHLLTQLAPDISQIDAQLILTALIDWITPKLTNTAFDIDYLMLNPPYRAAHRPMVSVSELRLVKGITPPLFNKLSPYFVTLPIVTPINLKTAPEPILMALQNSPLKKDQTTTTSEYFLLTTYVTVAHQQTITYTIFHRAMHESKATAAVIWQSKGSL